VAAYHILRLYVVRLAVKKTNIMNMVHHCDACSGAYRRLFDAVHRRSITKPEEFWGEAAEDIAWFKRWDRVLDDTDSPFTKW